MDKDFERFTDVINKDDITRKVFKDFEKWLANAIIETDFMTKATGINATGDAEKFIKTLLLNCWVNSALNMINTFEKRGANGK